MGCQDLYGSNMRPMGGTLGGMVSLEVGSENQQHGTLHGHGQAQVVCMYQYATLQEIARRVEEGLKLTQTMGLVDEMRDFQDWFHVERSLDVEVHDAYGDKAEEEFFDGFSAPSNAPLCQTPAF